jgi:ACT domain protein
MKLQLETYLTGDERMKLVVTVVGQDRVGIIAGVTRVLADNEVNVVSINQTILDGIFNMIMMCEVSDSADLSGIQKALAEEGERLGVQILAQNAAIFLSMHRVG